MHRLAAAVVVLALCAPACRPIFDWPRHVVLIVVDSLRADRATAEAGLMPNLARLASEGVRFENAYAAATSSVESTASILTGASPLGHRVASDGHAARLRPLQQLFAEAGYATFAAIGHPSFATLPTLFREGFDAYWAAEDFSGESSSEVTEKVRDHLRDGFDPHGINFLYIHYLDPHDPYAPRYHQQHPPVRDIGVDVFSKSGEPELRAGLERTAHHEGPRATPQSATMLVRMKSKYDAEVRRVDRGIGDIVAHLGRLGVLEDTLIVVTSDHGEAFLEHGQLGHGFQLYEEQVRVPLVIHRQGRIEAALRSDLASGIDVAPTLLAHAGLSLPDWMLGRDLLDEAPERPVLFATNYLNQRQRGIRIGSLKLIEDLHAGTVEVYDLEADPGERAPLPASRASAGADLVRALDALASEHAAIERGADVTPALPDAALQRRLRALRSAR